MPWLAGGDQDKAHERRRGAEAVLELRAVQANGDFDEYCTFHLDRERQRVHESCYADGIIPLAASSLLQRRTPILQRAPSHVGDVKASLQGATARP